MREFIKVEKHKLDSIKGMLEYLYNRYSLKAKKQLEQEGYGDCPRDFANAILAPITDKENEFIG